MIRTKVYGTAKITKRETWNHRYHAISRDNKGRFLSRQKWRTAKSTRQATTKAMKKKGIKNYTIGKEGIAYIEKYQEAPTGKKAKEKIVEAIKEEKWEEFEVETP